MYISKIKITNYRGVKDIRELNLTRFSSIVGKNDAGKTIVLNALATFLNIKNFSITQTDFNDLNKSIDFEFSFNSDNILELLESKTKSKVKKQMGLKNLFKI
ncbi:AAA family ATPase [Pedobacter sp. GR22-10]|uniref:AAA family ATPase n=1 Tax=Pedobacter sp. GR22-10 TaxID=2994472 RepID=UPI0022456478|nr:AAA family ATPase [Pedobacter sp. GR22-10]MCX2430887.1 AAA family ATPase [Pedobacter sp. GR22-10]